MSLPKRLLDMSDKEIKDVHFSLKNTVYPIQNEEVWQVINYCKYQDLDPFQKPVHFVVFNGKKQLYPGVQVLLAKASKMGCAGVSDSEFGPNVKRKYGNVEIEHPEWCRVTVKRLLPNNFVAEFTHTEYWDEVVSTNKEGRPNSMWSKRKRGQLAKCTLAGALRKGFPEVSGTYTFEEMEGQDGVVDIEAEEVTDKTPKRIKTDVKKQSEPVKEKVEAEEVQGKKLPNIDEAEEISEDATEIKYADSSILASLQMMAIQSKSDPVKVLEYFDLVPAKTFEEARIPVDKAKEIYAAMKAKMNKQ